MKKCKCPNCKSSDTVVIGDYQRFITFDETYTVTQLLCDNCGYEWERDY